MIEATTIMLLIVLAVFAAAVFGAIKESIKWRQ